jgi:hypothetical protein
MKTGRTLVALTLTLLTLCLPRLTLAQTKIAYGQDPMQSGELSLPEGDRPFPVVTFLHAGCWRSSEAMINSYRAMAKAMLEHVYS